MGSAGACRSGMSHITTHTHTHTHTQTTSTNDMYALARTQQSWEVCLVDAECVCACVCVSCVCVRLQLLDNAQFFEDGVSQTYTVFVNETSKPLIVTLVYNDYAGFPGAQKVRCGGLVHTHTDTHRHTHTHIHGPILCCLTQFCTQLACFQRTDSGAPLPMSSLLNYDLRL